MGLTNSKNSDSASSLITSDHKKNKDHITLVSYNIKVNSYSENKYENILMYITFDKKKIIYCIQGLYDTSFRKKMMADLNEQYNKYFPQEYIIPSNMNKKNIDIINSCGLFYISTFPIKSYYVNIFDIDDKFLKTFDNHVKGILTINTIIDNHLISIYNVCLQNDIKGILDCSDIRKIQIKKLFSIIENNHKMNQSYIHIIVGSLYDEIKHKKIIDSIDIKTIDSNNLYTNITDNKKYDYIYFYLYNYNPKNHSDILTYIHELGIEIVDNNIKDNITFSENYPCELVLKKLVN
jgi:hypothetical protein